MYRRWKEEGACVGASFTLASVDNLVGDWRKYEAAGNMDRLAWEGREKVLDSGIGNLAEVLRGQGK
jgi:hypothetical protein